MKNEIEELKKAFIVDERDWTAEKKAEMIHRAYLKGKEDGEKEKDLK